MNIYSETEEIEYLQESIDSYLSKGWDGVFQYRHEDSAENEEELLKKFSQQTTYLDADTAPSKEYPQGILIGKVGPGVAFSGLVRQTYPYSASILSRDTHYPDEAQRVLNALFHQGPDSAEKEARSIVENNSAITHILRGFHYTLIPYKEFTEDEE